MTVAFALTVGAGNFFINIGSFTLSAIGVATFGAIILYQILRERESQPEEMVSADSAVGLDPGAEPQAGAGE